MPNASTPKEATTSGTLNGAAEQRQASEALKRPSRPTQQARRKSQTRKRAQVQAKPETFTSQVADAAEAAILVPVGATLEARDAFVEAVTPWTTRTGAEKELDRVRRDVRRFERRGDRAVRGLRRRYNSVLREVRKRRNQTTRVVKKNRTQAQRTVKQNRRRVESEIRSRRRQVEKAVRRGRVSSSV